MGSGSVPIKSQRTGQAGGKEKPLYFGCRQLLGEGGVCPKADSPRPPTSKRESLYRHGEWRGPYAETAPSALTVIFRLVIAGLTSIILVVLATVNLQFPGALVPISLRPVLGIVAAHVLGSPVISLANFSTRSFSIDESSQDMAQNMICGP